MEVSDIKEKFRFGRGDPWDLRDDARYLEWRSGKLFRAQDAGQKLAPVEIRDLANPGETEKSELRRRCETFNAAFYAYTGPAVADEDVRDMLWGFSQQLGLRIAERHRSAGRHGIVALRVSDKARQKGYIPYSRRPMNWHTDGYYNTPAEKIRAMVLHCVRPARDGGVNQFMDPEIAYIRLRDENPDYIAALMHPETMTIPENREADGSVRPASVGPVFSQDPETGALEMRYTARTRSIKWRDDALTKEAVARLNALLSGGDPFMQTVKMGPGQGVLCNNSLHNRTGFDPDQNQDSERLLFRIRFHNRVPRS